MSLDWLVNSLDTYKVGMQGVDDDAQRGHILTMTCV